MCNNSRIYNVSRGFTLKHKQALRAIQNCAAEWVVFGESIRDLTLAESIAARKARALEHKCGCEKKVRCGNPGEPCKTCGFTIPEPLASVEIPGVIYEPSRSGMAATREGYALVRQANQMVTA